MYKKRQIYYIVMCVILTLGQLSEAKDSTAFMILGYLLAVAVALEAKSDVDLLGMMLFLLPNNRIFEIQGVSVHLIIMALYVSKYYLKNKHKISKPIFIWGLLLSAYSIIYINQGFSTVLLGIKVFIMVLFYTEIITKTRLNREMYSILIEYAVWGLVLSLFFAIVFNPEILYLSRVKLSEESNSNMLGIFAAVIFSSELVITFEERKLKNIIYLVLMLVVSFISTSRTAILAIALSVVWCFLLKTKKRQIKLNIIFAVLIIAFMLLTYFDIIHFSYVNQLIDRVINPKRGDISNGRYSLWIQYIDYLKNNIHVLFFGIGTTTVDNITIATSNGGLPAHNMFIEQLVMYGMLGSILVIGLYMASYFRIRKVYMTAKKVQYEYILGIVIVFVIGFFSHVLTSILVTSELYLGIIQLFVMSTESKMRNYNE